MLCTFTITAFAQSQQDAYQDAYKSTQYILSSNGIETDIIDNKLVLKNPTQENIDLANELLLQNNRARAKYPTSWVSMKSFNVDADGSRTFKRSTKASLISTLGTWLASFGSLTGLARNFVNSFFTDLFLNSDQEIIVYKSRYYYRETGPGRFDSNGNFMGDYEIKKEERVYSKRDGSLESTEITIKESTILDPSF